MQEITVTLTRKGAKCDAFKARYTLTVAELPGRSWAYGYQEMHRELSTLTALRPADIRGALLDAFTRGQTTVVAPR